MNHLARKKIVLVIVEGASDDTALGVALNQVFDKDSVYIHIMHGDITTRKGVNPQNTHTIYYFNHARWLEATSYNLIQKPRLTQNDYKHTLTLYS